MKLIPPLLVAALLLVFFMTRSAADAPLAARNRKIRAWATIAFSIIALSFSILTLKLRK